jgi:N-6 DNA Methylase
MADTLQWLINPKIADSPASGGIISVDSYSRALLLPEEVVIMEKAKHYGADAVFFGARRDGLPAVPQAFIYGTDRSDVREDFAELHRRLWSWGGVPLIYRVSSGLIELFRCAHRPDFEVKGEKKVNPFKTIELGLLLDISADPWWHEEQLRRGTLWDDPEVCKIFLSSKRSAHRTLIDTVKDLYEDVESNRSLPKSLKRRLLILSILIAYLEERKVFEPAYFGRFRTGATRFFEVLADGSALVNLLQDLEGRFNGHVFELTDEERTTLRGSKRLRGFADLIEGRQEPSGQRLLWRRYSFADLPVELISHVYQLFVEDTSVAVYTPHFVVRLMLGETLDWKRLDRLEKNDEVVLDGSCGSGIFLVEAYKRLVLHWRLNNKWKRPDETILKNLLCRRIRGVDWEDGAVELAAFSLCLALCDALEPEEIRSSVGLFPKLKGETLNSGCFFEAIENKTINGRVGVIVGNPPFTSVHRTSGIKRAHAKYQDEVGLLPDKQIAYLFLHASMELLVEGGVLSMLQGSNFLYNHQSGQFRQKFFERWRVREILDFVSIRGLFTDGDTKVVVVVAEASAPQADANILHATFRRSGRVDSAQGFDIDYYDMHWVPYQLTQTNDGVWRSDLVGGGRVLSLVDRLKEFRSLKEYARQNDWKYAQGYIRSDRTKGRPAEHITGKPSLPPEAMTLEGIDEQKIQPEKAKSFKSGLTREQFTPPILLIKEHMDLPQFLWTKHYLPYSDQFIGIAARDDLKQLRQLSEWLESNRHALCAYVAATSNRLFTQKNTAISGLDISSLPFPDSHSLDLSAHEKILVDDIVDHYRDLIRLGDKSAAMSEPGARALPEFNRLFTERINGIYREKSLRILPHYELPGVICQPYVFGDGQIEWDDADELRGKLDSLLHEKQGAGIDVTRIARLYAGRYIFFLKPNRLRYWLKSIALRDSDEVLADLAQQGF